MPVIKCANGKYRIGAGACIYETEDKATKVWSAILASGKYKADLNKVSYDYDDTLSTSRGKDLAKKLIAEGKTVYIISARQDKEGMLTTAKELGIPECSLIDLIVKVSISFLFFVRCLEVVEVEVGYLLDG